MGKQLKQIFRSHRWRLLFVMVPVTIAIALFVLMRMIIGNVETQISDQTKPLLWADIVIESWSIKEWVISFDQIVEYLSQYEFSQWIETSNLVEFWTNLLAEWVDPQLVNVLWVEENYPFYGEVTILWETWNLEWVYIDQETNNLFGTNWTVTLWTQEFPIRWIIETLPWASLNLFDNWRTILMPYDLVESTWLTQLWSRVEYELLIKVADENIEWLVAYLKNNKEIANSYRIRDYTSRAGQINWILEDFDRYITTVLIMSFLLVVVIVITTVRTFFTLEKRSIGLYKVLWQSTNSLMLVYTLLFSWAFLLAWILWCIIGSLGIVWLQTLPETAWFIVMPWVWFQSVVVLLIIAVVWLILPYGEIFWEDALSLLRTEKKLIRSRKARLVQPVVIGLWIWLFYGVILGERISGIRFSLGLLVVWWIIWMVVMSFLRFITKTIWKRTITWFMRYDWFRSSIAPWNQSVTLWVWLTIISTVVIILSILSQSFLTTLGWFTVDQPSLFILNIRQQDRPFVDETYPDAKLFDTILWRVVAINWISLQDHLRSQWQQWWRWGEFTREFNSTTSESAPVIAWKKVSPWYVTVDEEFAGRLWVWIWDVITFSIQWREVTLETSWLRKAERSWATPFFYFKFDAEEFKDAPRTYFRSAIVSKENKGIMKRTLIENLWPHLSFVDVDEIIENVQSIAEKIIAVIEALLVTVFVLIVCSAFVAIESLWLLRTKKVSLYTKLWATKTMIKESLSSELRLIILVAVWLWSLVAIVALWQLFSRVSLIAFENVMVLQWFWIIVWILLCYWVLGRIMRRRM